MLIFDPLVSESEKLYKKPLSEIPAARDPFPFTIG
jgi:hypothetical protein